MKKGDLKPPRHMSEFTLHFQLLRLCKIQCCFSFLLVFSSKESFMLSAPYQRKKPRPCSSELPWAQNPPTTLPHRQGGRICPQDWGACSPLSPFLWASPPTLFRLRPPRTDCRLLCQSTEGSPTWDMWLFLKEFIIQFFRGFNFQKAEHSTFSSWELFHTRQW